RRCSRRIVRRELVTAPSGTAMRHAASIFPSGGQQGIHPSASELWWLRPAPLVVLVIVPLYLSFLAFDYENVVPRRYVPNANYVWRLVLLLTLALGCALGAGLRNAPGDLADAVRRGPT